MFNPLALTFIVFGIFLLLCGLFLIVKRKKTAGTIISLLGLGACAVPFLASYFTR
jgi:uncharacterized membrane protein YozB (DUF420 family)